MASEGFCDSCNLSLPSSDYYHHLELYHVGAPSLEMFEMKCGHCSFAVAAPKLQDMLHHCRYWSHGISAVSVRLDAFAAVETDRVHRMLGLLENMDTSRLPKPSILGKPKRVATKELVTLEEEEERPSKHSKPDSPLPSSPPKKEQNRDGDNEELSEDEVQPPLKIFHPQNTPSSAERKTKVRRGPTKKCQLCDQLAPSWGGMVAHAITHNKEIRPFKCATCDHRCNKSGPIKYVHTKSKSAQEFGCNGSYVNVQDAEMNVKIRDILRAAYPSVDWEAQYPEGTSADGILF